MVEKYIFLSEEGTYFFHTVFDVVGNTSRDNDETKSNTYEPVHLNNVKINVSLLRECLNLIVCFLLDAVKVLCAIL